MKKKKKKKNLNPFKGLEKLDKPSLRVIVESVKLSDLFFWRKK